MREMWTPADEAAALILHAAELMVQARAATARADQLRRLAAEQISVEAEMAAEAWAPAWAARDRYFMGTGG